MLAATPSASDPEAFAGRPSLSAPEQPARLPATCSDLGAQLKGLATPKDRIDLSIVGPLTLVKTDGALWYLAVCSNPGVRVLCVTYSANGMKAGDQVLLSGGYNRQDETHVVLDPCLASSR